MGVARMVCPGCSAHGQFSISIEDGRTTVLCNACGTESLVMLPAVRALHAVPPEDRGARPTHCPRCGSALGTGAPIGLRPQDVVTASLEDIGLTGPDAPQTGPGADPDPDA